MEIGAEKVTPYDDSRHKSEQVKEMFDTIAPAYDFMNRAMTMGIDKLWRAKAVRRLARVAHADILDVATGTGDLAIRLARKLKPASVTGVDLSQGMIEIGRRKVREAGLSDIVKLSVADCLSLPFADESFDCVTVAYGVRNFENLLDGYREMARVLRPGGTICVLELTTPTSPLVKPLYRFYTKRVIPALGRKVSHDVRAYSYLPESIAAMPQGVLMAVLMAEAGFTNCSFKRMTFGTCTLYTAVKKG